MTTSISTIPVDNNEIIIDLSHIFNDEKQTTSITNDATTNINTSTNTEATATLLIDCKCELGEGIIYDNQSNSILWTDILLKQMHVLILIDNDDNDNENDDDTTTTIRNKNSLKGIHRIYNLPKMLGSFGLIDSVQYNINISLPLLCAWEDGFQLYDIIQNKELSTMSIGIECVNPYGLPSRLNDGRTDPYGKRYICGGYYGGMFDIKMKVFKCEQQLMDDNNKKQLVHTPIVQETTTTNSICWSNDGTTMYLADSPTKEIHSYTYCKDNGTISNKKLIHTKLKNTVDVPDGSCIDNNGYIWNAVWKNGAGQSYVQCINPLSGSIVYTVHIPYNTSQITCCCFGTKKYNILFITTAKEQTLSTNESYAGGLFAIQLPKQYFCGIPEKRLQFTI